MKKTLWTLAGMMMVGFALVGCDSDEATTCTTNADCTTGSVCVPGATAEEASVCMKANCGDVEYCADPAQCVDVSDGTKGCFDQTCEAPMVPMRGDDGAITCGNPDVKPEVNDKYIYVQIQDLSNDKDFKAKDDPGADIDAIALEKAGGDITYVKDIVAYSNEKAEGADEKHKVATDPSKAKGAPDAFKNYPDHEKGICYYHDKPVAEGGQYTFVSLGGGYLIVEMEKAIEAGDKLTVFELGGCKLRNLKSGPDDKTVSGAEEMKVSVSVSKEVGGTWKDIGTFKADKDTNKGVITQTISGGALN